jgi:hypothetical protein
MQVATVLTPDMNVRSEIDGRTYEDSDLLVRRSRPSSNRIFIGFTPEPHDIPYYTCVLEMLADGWELLGPPQREGCEVYTQWGWWLQRKSPPR